MSSMRNWKVIADRGDAFIGAGSFVMLFAKDEFTYPFVLSAIAAGTFWGWFKGSLTQKKLHKNKQKKDIQDLFGYLINEVETSIAEYEAKIARDNEKGEAMIKAAIAADATKKPPASTTDNILSPSSVVIFEQSDPKTKEEIRQAQIAQRVKARETEMIRNRKEVRVLKRFENASADEKELLVGEYKEILKRFKKDTAGSAQNKSSDGETKSVSHDNAGTSEEKKESVAITMPQMQIATYHPSDEWLSILGEGVQTTGNMGLVFYNFANLLAFPERVGFSILFGSLFGTLRAYFTNADEKIEFMESKESGNYVIKLQKVKDRLEKLKETKREQNEALDEMKTVFAIKNNESKAKASDALGLSSVQQGDAKPGRQKRPQAVSPLASALQEVTAASPTAVESKLASKQELKKAAVQLSPQLQSSTAAMVSAGVLPARRPSTPSLPGLFVGVENPKETAASTIGKGITAENKELKLQGAPKQPEAPKQAIKRPESPKQPAKAPETPKQSAKAPETPKQSAKAPEAPKQSAERSQALQSARPAGSSPTLAFKVPSMGSPAGAGSPPSAGSSQQGAALRFFNSPKQARRKSSSAKSTKHRQAGHRPSTPTNGHG